MQEKTIIQKILAGDSESYRLLVERYQTGLIIHCENIMKDRADGEDIAQDAFIKAFRSLGRFSDEKAQFSTWLYHIATNLCIDQLRKSKKRVSIKNIEPYLESVQPAYEEVEERDFLQKMIETLEPPKYAALIKAYFWEGKSYSELAKEYDTTTGTIGTWMSRAKLQLKGKLS